MSIVHLFYILIFKFSRINMQILLKFLSIFILSILFNFSILQASNLELPVWEYKNFRSYKFDGDNAPDFFRNQLATLYGQITSVTLEEAPEDYIGAQNEGFIIAQVNSGSQQHNLVLKFIDSLQYNKEIAGFRTLYRLKATKPSDADWLDYLVAPLAILSLADCHVVIMPQIMGTALGTYFDICNTPSKLNDHEKNERETALAIFGRLLGSMHRAGYCHNDANWGAPLYEPQKKQVYLVDCGGFTTGKDKINNELWWYTWSIPFFSAYQLPTDRYESGSGKSLFGDFVNERILEGYKSFIMNYAQERFVQQENPFLNELIGKLKQWKSNVSTEAENHVVDYFGNPLIDDPQGRMRVFYDRASWGSELCGRNMPKSKTFYYQRDFKLSNLSFTELAFAYLSSSLMLDILTEVESAFGFGSPKMICEMGKDDQAPYTLKSGFSRAEGSHRWTEGKHVNIDIPTNHQGHRLEEVNFVDATALVTKDRKQFIQVIGNNKTLNTFYCSHLAPQQSILLRIADDVNLAQIGFNIPYATSPAFLKMNSDTRILGLQFKQVELSYAKKFHHLGSATDFPYALEGFCKPEGTHRWTEGQSATIDIPVVHHNHRVKCVSFLATESLITKDHSQNVHVSVNGIPTGSYHFTVHKPQQSIHVAIPDGIDTAKICFHTPNATSPAALQISPDTRVLGINLKQVEVSCSKRIYNLGGTTEGSTYCLRNFGSPEGIHRWSMGPYAAFEVLLSDNPAERPQSVAFLNTSALVTPTHSLSVAVKLRDNIVENLQYTSTNNNQSFYVKIPSDLKDLAHIQFAMPNAASPQALGINEDPRNLGILFKEVVFTYPATF